MTLQVETTLYQVVTLALCHKLKYLLTSMELQIVSIYQLQSISYFTNINCPIRIISTSL